MIHQLYVALNQRWRVNDEKCRQWWSD